MTDVCTNYLYFGLISLFFCIVAMVVGSLTGPEPEQASVSGLTYWTALEQLQAIEDEKAAAARAVEAATPAGTMPPSAQPRLAGMLEMCPAEGGGEGDRCMSMSAKLTESGLQWQLRSESGVVSPDCCNSPSQICAKKQPNQDLAPPLTSRSHALHCSELSRWWLGWSEGRTNGPRSPVGQLGGGL